MSICSRISPGAPARSPRRREQRARALGLAVVELDTWYDVDDAAALRRLCRELASARPARRPCPLRRPGDRRLHRAAAAFADADPAGPTGVKIAARRQEEHGCRRPSTDRCPPLFRGGRRAALAGRRGAAGLRLSRSHQPLQSAVRDLPAHLRGTGAAGRYELGAVHLDRRPGAGAGARRIARRRRADAGQEPAAHDPLPEGARRLRAVQHQRHACSRRASAGS